jgi:SAM-dependent methyltransferase
MVEEWFESDEFWRRCEPFLFTAEHEAEAEDEVSLLLALADPPGHRVLDLCCGTGRHAVPLARRGMAVTGVDRTALYLAHARDRARRAGVEVEWVQQDAREYRRPGAHDLVISLYTSLGLFEDDADDLRVLSNARESLAPGGRLVIEMVSREWIAENFEETVADDGPDGSILFRRHRIVDDWRRIENRWTLVEGNRAAHFAFSQRIYSGPELQRLIERAGFEEVQLHGGLDGSPYGYGAGRLVAVSRAASTSNRG